MFEWKICERFSFACLWLAALAAPRCTAPPKKSCGNALDLPPLYCTQEMRQCARQAVVQQSSKELLPGSCCFSGDYGRKAWKPKCGVTQSFTHHGQVPLVFIVLDLTIFLVAEYVCCPVVEWRSLWSETRVCGQKRGSSICRFHRIENFW